MLADVGQRNDFPATSEYVMSQLRNEVGRQEADRAGPGVRSPRQPEGNGHHPERLRLVDVDGTALQDQQRHARLDRIVVDRKPPITLVMPFLRKTFGVA